MSDPTGSARHISGGTGIALSLVVSIVVAAFNAGITFGIVQRLQTDVMGLQSKADSSTSGQHAQALELTELRSELKAVRESQARVEQALLGSSTRGRLVRGQP